MGVLDRVLLVVRGLDPAGTGRQVELAAAALAAAGSRVAVATTTTVGSLPARLESRGITVHRIGSRPVHDVAATMRLVNLSRKLRPTTLIGFGRSEACRVAIARSLTGLGRAVGWLGIRPAGTGQALALRRLDRIMVTSPAVAAGCDRMGVVEDRVAVVPPGISPDSGTGLSRREVAARIGLDPSRAWTLTVAPLEPLSRLPRLLWAIDQLGVVRDDLQHVLVGAGPLRHPLSRRARAQELDERLFVLPDCDLLTDLLGHVRLVWQSGDVAVGGAILDGMARGLPAVAVRSDTAEQLIEPGVSGQIVPPKPESDFPRAAFRILEDEPLARRYGEAGAARAAALFSEEEFVARLMQALSSGHRATSS